MNALIHEKPHETAHCVRAKLATMVPFTGVLSAKAC